MFDLIDSKEKLTATLDYISLFTLSLFLIILAYKGMHDSRCPIYSIERMSLRDMVDICIGENVVPSLVCTSIPQHVYQNANFVLDLSQIHAMDLTADGLIYNSQSCPTKLVKVEYVLNKLILCRIVKGAGDSVFKMRRQYSHCFSARISGISMKRTITKFERTDSAEPNMRLVISAKGA